MVDTQSVSRRLTTQDASFLYSETPNGPMHGGTIGVFEGEMPFDALLSHIEGRLHLIQRYRQRLAFVPFNFHHAVWEDSPDFKLADHVEFHQLPPGASLADAVTEAIRVNEPMLDRAKPLWRTHMFQGVPGLTVLLSQAHHAMVDGVSSVELSTVLMDYAADAPPPPPPTEPWNPPPSLPPAQLFSDAVYDTLQEQIESLRRNGELLRSPASLAERTARLNQATASLTQVMSTPIVAAPWNAGQVGRERTFAWLRYPFADFRAIRATAGGTLNDVVLTIATEAAARYLRHHGYATDGQNLRLMCPVNVRREDQGGALGNRVSGMFPTMPASPMDPLQRHELIKAETLRIKESGQAQGLELLTETAPPTPPGLMAPALLAALAPALPAFPLPPRPAFPAPQFGVNFVLTNVPGVQVPQYMAGHKCLDQFSPLMISGTLGYGVVVSTYNQNLYFSLVGEPRLLPDIDRMAAFLAEVFQELKDACPA